MESALKQKFIIVAGPNGAGKSTMVDAVRARFSGIVFLNADERTKQILAENPTMETPAANLQAAQEVDAAVFANIQNGTSQIVETVLSSNKYRDAVLAAKARGFEINMAFVTNQSPELSIARVAQRVAMGGHHVDSDKIRARWNKTHEQLLWFALHVDELQVLDNSSREGHKIVFSKAADGTCVQHASAPNQYIADLMTQMTGGAAANQARLDLAS